MIFRCRKIQETAGVGGNCDWTGGIFGPPAIPPKRLPPSPHLNVDGAVARQDYCQPAGPPVNGLFLESSPPPLPPPLPPLSSKLLPTCSSKTPQPPSHPPPNLAHTSAAPNHPHLLCPLHLVHQPPPSTEPRAIEHPTTSTTFSPSD